MALGTEVALIRETTERHSRVWPTATLYLGLALYLMAPQARTYPAALVGIIAFSVTLMICRNCRPARDAVVSPLNWALFAFFLQLVVTPLLLCFFGPFQSVLPFLPSGRATNLAMLLSSGAFIAFCVGYEVGVGWKDVDRSPQVWRYEWPLIGVLLAIGMVGLLLTFGNIANVIAYFTGPSSRLEFAASSEASVLQVLGILLRPFLGFGVVAAWCHWIDRHRPSLLPALAMVTIVVVLVVLAYGTFSYNRGSFVAPSIAVLAVYGARVRRIRPLPLIALGLVGFTLLTGFRVYRTSQATVPEFLSDPTVRTGITEQTDLNRELQVYAGSPQFLGFILEGTGYGQNLYWGRTLVSSTLYPVPVLGKAFRETSGVAIYNRLIYSRSRGDQVIPFQAEMFLNFHLPGVLVGFFLLGTAVSAIQRAFARAPTALQTFVWQYTATWIAFLIAGSIAAVSQVLIYFFWPAYMLAGMSLIRGRLMRGRAGRASTFHDHRVP